MAEISKSLSDVLDTSQSKEVRLLTLSSLRQNLEQRELLRDVLDAVHFKWKRLTELFFSERDDEVLAELSTFLAGTGKVAVLYGRFSGSVVDPLVYLVWVQKQICRDDIALQHLELLLEGLSLCLSDLEGTAFKSVAPSLLSACRRLLSGSETPISLFGAILDVMRSLCKVPSAVRDQFTEVMDLVLGWGSCPETPCETLPKIRSLLRQLGPNWQCHLKQGSDWILSIMKDLYTLIESGFTSSEEALIFLNTSACLMAIFESCASYLLQATFAETFTHVRYMTQSLMCIPSVVGPLSAKQFAEQIAWQLSITSETLINGSVPNAVMHVMKILTEATQEVYNEPEKLANMVVLQTRFLETVIQMKKLTDIEGLCEQAYGNMSVVYDLRCGRWKPLVEATADLYQVLLCKASAKLQTYFSQLFFNDLQSIERGEVSSQQETRSEHQDECLSSAGRIQSIQHRSSAAQSCSDAAIYTTTHLSMLKRQLFALTLFFRCVNREEDRNDFVKDVRRAVEELCRRGVHPVVLLHSAKLLRKIWMRPSSSQLSAIASITAVMSRTGWDENNEVSMMVMKWLAESVTKLTKDDRLSCDIEQKLLDRLKTVDDVCMIKAVLSVMQEAFRTGIQLTHAVAFLRQLCLLASSTDSQVSQQAVNVLADCGSFCLFCRDAHEQRIEEDLLAVVLQPQVYSLRSSQLASFLKRVTSGTIPNPSNETCTDWILQLAQDVTPSFTPTEDAIVKLEDLSSMQTKAHHLVHEAAKFVVSTRFRSIESGPSKLLKLVKDRLSDLAQQLRLNKTVDRFHVWLMLEFLSGLQKQIFCGYDGAHLTRSPPPLTWGYYAVNQIVFEEGFSRLFFKQLFISNKCAFHHHAALFGCAFLKQQCKDARKLVAELQQQATPKQTVLKVRQKPSEELTEKLTYFFSQFIEGIQLTCTSLIRISSPSCILGLRSEVSPAIDNLVQTLMENDIPGLLLWMDGCVYEARQRYEKAIELYKQTYEKVLKIQEDLKQTQKSDALPCIQSGVEAVQLFVLERLAVCYSKGADWERFNGADVRPYAAELNSLIPIEFHCMEMAMLYDGGNVEKAADKMKRWESESYEVHSINDPDVLHNLAALRTCLRQCTSEVATEDGALREAFHRQRHLFPHTQQSEMLKLAHLLRLEDCPMSHMILEPFRRLVSTNVPHFSIPFVFPELQYLMPEYPKSCLDSGWLNNVNRLAHLLGDVQTTCTTALLVATFETEKENYDRAARVLRSVKETIKQAPQWMQLALGTETCRLSLLSRANARQAHLMLIHYWNIVTQTLKSMNASQLEQETAELISLWLFRFVQILSPFLQDVEANAALDSVEVPDMSHLVQRRYYQQLQEAGYGCTGSSVAHPVAHMQSFCIALSLELKPNHPLAWKHFSQMLIAQMDVASEKDVLVQHAAFALCKSLQYGNTVHPDFDVLMEMFAVLKHHGDVVGDDAFVQELLGVSPHVWKPVIRQLFSLMGRSDCKMTLCIARLLTGVTEVARSSVMYIVLEEWRKEKDKGDGVGTDIETLLRFFNGHHPNLLHEASVLVDELYRLNSLLSEEWLSVLTDAQMEYQIRIGVLGDEIKRIEAETTDHKKSVCLSEAYQLILMPQARSLRKKLDDKKRLFSMTPFEKNYWTKFSVKLEDSVGLLEAPLEEISLQEVQRRWSCIKTLMREAADEMKIPLPPLDQISPRLYELVDTELPLPGSDSGEVTICRFGSEVEILSTKTRPKKLTMIGSDGMEYGFLLKGKEDLHIDEHLLQLIRLMNMLHIGLSTWTPRVYSVTPLGDRIGLIQWVDQTVSFYALFRQWQSRQQKKLKELNDTSPKTRTVPPMITQHPKDIFQKALNTILNESDAPRITSRNGMPIEVLSQVFEKLQAESPSELLSNEIWGISSNYAAWWKKTQTFAESVALGSALCYVLGIGDRHLDNMLLDMRSAQVVNIDFNLCFGSGEKLRVPEIVPFRMTQNIQVAVGFGGVKGIFRESFISTLKSLRNHEKSLMTFLEAILTDPVMDWTTERTKRAFPQNLEIALRLELLFHRLKDTAIHEHCSLLEGIRNHAENSLDASSRLQEHTERRCLLQQDMKKTDDAIRAALSQQRDATVELHQQEESQTKHKHKLEGMRGTLEQILALNQNWCYRHGRLLQALLEQTDELLLLSQEQWNSAFAAQALDFVNPASPITILGLLFGGLDASDALPEELIEKCLIVDQERAVVDNTREARFLSVLEAMQKYVLTVKGLFAEEYICSSHHFRWMQSLESALSWPSLHQDPVSVADVLESTSKEDVQSMYSALSKAYTMIEERIESASVPRSETLAQAQNNAVAKTSPVQRALSTGWTGETFKGILRGLCKRFISLFGSFILIKYIVRRPYLLLRESQGCIQDLLGSLWDVNGSETSSTGFKWLDSVEHYVSQVAIVVRQIKNGPLNDLQTFMESGLGDVGKRMADRFEHHKRQTVDLCKQAWDIHHRRSLLCGGSGEQSDAQPCRPSHDAKGDGEKEKRLQLETNKLMEELEVLCQRFVQDLCGLTQRCVRLTNGEEDAIELNISSREWGQMHFPLLHGLFEVFELYETSENEVLPFRQTNDRMDDDGKRFGFPPSMQKLDCWLDSTSLAAALTKSMYDTMSNTVEQESDLELVVDCHYASILTNKIQPIILKNMTDIISVTQTLSPRSDGSSDCPLLEEDVDQVWECLRAQGAFDFAALTDRSDTVWCASDHADQATRLRHLAAFEWCHGADLDFPETLAGPYLIQFLQENQTLGELPITSHEAVVGEMKAAVESLLDTADMVDKCEKDGDAVAFELQQHLLSVLRGCSDDANSVELVETLQMLIEGRQTWRQGAIQHISGITTVAQTMLQFEFSRSAQTWNPGKAPDDGSFARFRMWFNEFCRELKRFRITEDGQSNCREKMEALQVVVQEQQRCRERLTTDLEKAQCVILESAPSLEDGAKALFLLSAQAAEHHALLQPCLTQILGSWMKELIDQTNGTKNTEEISKRAIDCQSVVEDLLHQLEKSRHLFIPDVGNVQKALTEMEQRKPSASATAQPTELVSVELADLETFRDVASSASQGVKKMRDYIHAMSLLANAVEAIMDGPLGQTTCSPPSRPSQLVSKKEDNIWVCVENLSEADSNEDFVVDIQDNASCVSEEMASVAEVSDASSSELTPSANTSNTPRLARPLTQRQLEYADVIMKEFNDRLLGKKTFGQANNREHNPNGCLSVEEQTDALISQATDPRRLCRMYEGWMPWI